MATPKLTFDIFADDKTAQAFRSVTRSLETVGDQVEKVGRKMQNIGRKMSVGISAPIMGAMAGIGAAMHGLAGEIKELDKQAQLSGTSIESFQKLAHAAKSVGIENDKLSDIFKDMNDRIGDFAQTGGGEMKDFFEKIAPQVGITADAFKNLSGPQALQLYYNALEKAGLGHADMVFYLESVADEATALIPLLREGGKGFRELGEGASVISDEDAAGLRKYNQAMQGLSDVLRSLKIQFAQSGIIEVITDIVDRVAEFTRSLSKVNPEIVKFVAVIAGVAAFAGPALVALGTFAIVVSAISAPMLAAVGSGAATGIRRSVFR